MKKILFLVSTLLVVQSYAIDIKYEGSVQTKFNNFSGPLKDVGDNYVSHYITPHIGMMFSKDNTILHFDFKSFFPLGGWNSITDNNAPNSLDLYQAYIHWMQDKSDFKAGRMALNYNRGLLFSKNIGPKPNYQEGFIYTHGVGSIDVAYHYLIFSDHGKLPTPKKSPPANDQQVSNPDPGPQPHSQSRNGHLVRFNFKKPPAMFEQVSFDYYTFKQITDVEEFTDVSLNGFYFNTFGDLMGLTYDFVYGSQKGTLKGHVADKSLKATLLDIDLGFEVQKNFGIKVHYHSSSGTKKDSDSSGMYTMAEATEMVEKLNVFNMGNLNATTFGFYYKISSVTMFDFHYGSYSRNEVSDVRFGHVGKALNLTIPPDNEEKDLAKELAITVTREYKNSFSTSMMIDKYDLGKAFHDGDTKPEGIFGFMLGFNYKF